MLAERCEGIDTSTGHRRVREFGAETPTAPHARVADEIALVVNLFPEAA